MYGLYHPGGLASIESTWDRRHKFYSWVGKIPWKRAWQSIPVFLPGESLWTEEPGGLQSMGSQRVGHDWASKPGTNYCTDYKDVETHLQGDFSVRSDLEHEYAKFEFII